MASIQDVADQINGKLDAITANTANTAASSAQAVNLLQGLRQEATEANTRLDNLAEGLFALVELQRSALHLLDHHRRQNDTIICELVNTNALLCGITRKMTEVVDNGDRTVSALERLEAIAERVHPAEAADHDRAAELERKIEQCCPPRQKPPEPCPPTCTTPGFDPRQPSGQDWKPLPGPRPVG